MCHPPPVPYGVECYGPTPQQRCEHPSWGVGIATSSILRRPTQGPCLFFTKSGSLMRLRLNRHHRHCSFQFACNIPQQFIFFGGPEGIVLLRQKARDLRLTNQLRNCI